MKPVRSAARALLSAIFVTSGARALANPDRLVAPAQRMSEKVAPLLERAAPRLPTDPRSLVRLNGAAQLVGGLLLATGHMTRPAAAMLAGSMVPTTVAGHPFWRMRDPAERQQHQTHFMKNLAILGGLALAAADTEGKPGLRWRAAHMVDHTSRAARTARRQAKLAVRAANAGRHLPG
jgi:uncharacterized membrane protein YphA (DoxX/SURF4 family)